MPARTNADGSFASEPWTAGDITAMAIRSADVRQGNHPTETRRRDENTMVRTFFVNWASRYDFVQFVLGDSVLYTDVSGTPTVKISRLIPATNYGRHPYTPQVMATRVEYIKGHGSCRLDPIGNGFPSYDLRATDCAEIQVFYEQCPFSIQSDAGLTSERHRFTSRGESSSEVEAFTFPGAGLRYVTATGTGAHGIPIPFNLSFTRPVRRFTMWWHYLPNALYDVNGALFQRLYVGVSGDGIPWLGCVSKETLTLPGMGAYGPGQLLLEGVEEKSITSPLAESGLSGLRWDIGLKFAYCSRGWNDLFFYDPATPANSGYFLATNNGTYYARNAIPDKTALYNTRDFTSIWDPNL